MRSRPTRCWSRPALAALVLAGPLLAGCARAQKPVLYPNTKVREVGREQAQRDIEDCRRLAGDYVQSSAAKEIGRDAAVGGAAGAATGAVGGAVAGAVTGRGAGTGAATGAAVGAATGATAGAVRSGVRRAEPSPIYKAFVDRCLRERGYDVIGWE